MSHFERGVCRRGHFDCATESLVAQSKENFTVTCRRAQQVAVLSVDSSYPLVIPDDLIRIISSLSFRRHEQQSRKAGASSLHIQASIEVIEIACRQAHHATASWDAQKI